MSSLNPSELLALRDCASMRRGTYIWRQKTMAKLALKGVVEQSGTLRNQPVWVVTEDGEAALKAAARK